MHSENPFDKNYNFNQLVHAHPKLEQYIVPGKFARKSIDFSNPAAVEALNTALIKWKFGLRWTLKPGHLCPAVPGRFDYLLHARDLFKAPTDRRVEMLDIGTGATLIYPLLATAAFNWNCTASDVDKEALSYAKGLIRMNKSMQGTRLRRQPFKSNILEHVIAEDDYFDVVVCNPPFYKTKAEAERSNARKNKNLHGSSSEHRNFGGSSNELWYKGGEEAFLKAMALESAKFKEQVHWFTSLVSKKEHIKTLKRFINKGEPKEVRVVEMDHGHKQTRFVAWTFGKPEQESVLGTNTLPEERGR